MRRTQFFRKGYKNYSEHDLDLAALAYLKKEMNLDTAVEFYKVPRMTVYRRAKKLQSEMMLHSFCDVIEDRK